MDRTEQVMFIISVNQLVIGKLVESITSGNIPEEWQGGELREYLQDAFKNPYVLSGKRKKNYQNEMIVRNLLW